MLGLVAFVYVFVAMAALDFVWAKYSMACADRRAWAAPCYAALIVVFNGPVVISYVDNHWLLLPAIAGAFCGTRISMRKTILGHWWGKE